MDRRQLNSWPLLLYTRAITPPRGLSGAWLGGMYLRRGGWSLLLLGTFLVVGVAVRVSQRDDLPVPAQAISPISTVPSPPSPARPVPRW
jgi:hypothetical protein